MTAACSRSAPTASTWRSSCRWSATRVYRSLAAQRLADLAAARRRGRASVLRRAQRRRAVRGDRARPAADALPHARTARRSTRRSTSPQTIPAMVLAHLTVAGVVEFALTAGVIAYLQRANLPVLRINHADVPDDRRRASPPRRARLALGAGRARRDGACSRRSACSRRVARSARTRRAISTCSKYHLDAVPARACSTTPASGTTRCSTATTSPRRHPTIGYVVSAVVGIARSRRSSLVVSRRCRARACVSARRRRATASTRARGVTAAPGRHPTGCCSPKSGCARAAASASAARAASSRRRSTAPPACCARRCSPRTSPRRPGCCSASTRG